MKQKKPFGLRLLGAFVGLLAGVLYTTIYFGAIGLKAFGDMPNKEEKQVLFSLALWGALGVILFFVLSFLIGKKLKLGGRYAFPMGAFMASDAALVAAFVFLRKMGEGGHTALLAFCQNNVELAKSYLRGMMILIAVLTAQVILWLISMLLTALRYLQGLTFDGGSSKEKKEQKEADRAKMEADLRIKIQAEMLREQMKEERERAEALASHMAMKTPLSAKLCTEDDLYEDEPKKEPTEPSADASDAEIDDTADLPMEAALASEDLSVSADAAEDADVSEDLAQGTDDIEDEEQDV